MSGPVLLECPRPGCGRAWLLPAVLSWSGSSPLDSARAHLRRAHRLSEVQVAEALSGVVYEPVRVAERSLREPW